MDTLPPPPPLAMVTMSSLDRLLSGSNKATAAAITTSTLTSGSRTASSTSATTSSAAQLPSSSLPHETDDEVEPFLNYHPLSEFSVEGVTSPRHACTISTAAITHKFLILGTHQGNVLVLDVSLGTVIREFPLLHNHATVNAISIDDRGEYFASAGDDGRVVITSLYGGISASAASGSTVTPSFSGAVTTPQAQPSSSSSYNMKRPIKAVCLEPEYSKRGTFQFVSGGTSEMVIISAKGWFAPTENIIHQGEGPIYTCCWKDEVIIWTNEVGVQFYDTVAQFIFSTILRPTLLQRSDLLRCRVTWKGPSVFYMSWGNTIQIGSIKKENGSKSVSIHQTIITDLIISGVSPFGDKLVVLSQRDPEFLLANQSPSSPHSPTKQGGSSRRRRSARPPDTPVLHVMDHSGIILTSDQLPSSPNVSAKFHPNDYHLLYLGGDVSHSSSTTDEDADATYYIVSPNSILYAKPRDMDGHIQWLMERRRYEEALKALRQQESGHPKKMRSGKLKAKDIISLGLNYIREMVDQGRFEEAASQCPKIFQSDASLWEEWIRVFADKEKLSVIVMHIPVDSPRLSESLYNFVLQQLLQSKSHSSLVRILKTWPKEVYDYSTLSSAIQVRINETSSTTSLLKPDFLLLEAAYIVCGHNRQYDRVLHLGLQLHAPGLVSLVVTHGLYSSLSKHIPLLLEYDAFQINTSVSIMQRIHDILEGSDDRIEMQNDDILPAIGQPPNANIAKLRIASHGEGVQLLVQNTRKFAVGMVMQELREYPRFQLIYLDALFQSHPHEGKIFHLAQARLYAQYDQERLLEFLKSSSHYSIPKALIMCEELDLVPEMVYLLARMGDTRKALALIIERQNDVSKAIAFAQEQQDPELWDHLLSIAMDKPGFILGLLDSVGHEIPPVKIIRRIPDELQIPGLKNSLLRVLNQYSAHLKLRAGSRRVIMSESMDLLNAFQALQARPQTFQPGKGCSICHLPFTASAGNEEKIVAFFCRHAYHLDCMNSSLSPNQKQDHSRRRIVGMALPDSLYHRMNAVYGREMSDSSSLANGKMEPEEGIQKDWQCPLCA